MVILLLPISNEISNIKEYYTKVSRLYHTGRSFVCCLLFSIFLKVSKKNNNVAMSVKLRHLEVFMSYFQPDIYLSKLMRQ